MQSADVFTLEAQDWHVKIDAARGGLISECRWKGLEILSTAKANVWPAEAHAGCFPLVPYSNRIRDAAFSFAGLNVSLPVAAFAMPHGLHGLGWRHPWKLRNSRADSVVWTQTNTADAWPWAYEARQRLAIDGSRLTLTLEIENTGTGSMPAGIGLHPYFPRRPDMEISVRAAGIWQTESSEPGIPTRWSARDPSAEIFKGKHPDSDDLDHCFTGWNRTARLDYHDTKLRIDLSASETLSNIVVYCPAGRNVLCLEPVSHVNDAANLPGLDPLQGMDCLEPGKRLSGTLNLDVSRAD
jgi:aldose 1-epimerase